MIQECGQFDLWFLCFSYIQFVYLTFSVHVLLNLNLKDFECYLASMWNECHCGIVRAFFGIALLWDWNGSWPFPVLWPLLFSKFAGILSAAFQQHHLLGVEIVFRSFSFRESMPLMCFILGLLCLCLIGDYDANARYSFGALCVSGRNVFCRYLQFWKEKASHISRARHLIKESITKITRCHIIF